MGSAAAALLDPGGRVVSVDPAGRPREPFARSGLWGVLDPESGDFEYSSAGHGHTVIYRADTGKIDELRVWSVVRL